MLARMRLAERHEASVLDDCDVQSITGRTVGRAALAGDALALRLDGEVRDEIAAHESATSL